MDEAAAVNLANFYSADAETMLCKFRQLEHLIGRSHHAGSEGTYCESLLKEFLRRTLPKRVSIDGRFIRRVFDDDHTSLKSPPLEASAPFVTPQLDIIIHDTQSYAPLFRSEDTVVVLPEAVCGVIEIKKTLDQSKLTDAVSNITRTTHLLRKWRNDAHRVFTGIFAFNLDDGLKPSSKPISDSFENAFQKAYDRYKGGCDLPYLTMALSDFALQRSSQPNQFDLYPTIQADGNGPNIAGQFLVFLLSNFAFWGTHGRSLPYPEGLRSTRQTAFTIVTNEKSD